MIGRSFETRLFVASAALLPLFLGLAGYALEVAFRDALLDGEREKARVQSYLLLAAVELDQGRVVVREPLHEPRYEQFDSGLYAEIRASDGTRAWRSRSAALLEMPRLAPRLPLGQTEFGESKVGELALFHYRHGLAWEGDDGSDVPFELVIWRDQAPYHAQLARYRGNLLRGLGLVALLLVVLQLAILRWGLRPLSDLARDLERVREGEDGALAGPYPAEIAPLTQSLDRLLASERSRRERYRETLANLAHSLKTPLAVLRGAIETDTPAPQLRRHVEEELDRMEGIVAHQLSRAQRRGAPTLGERVAIAPVVERLVGALSKVYRAQAPRFELEIEEGSTFPGDEGDLMELLGNLLDNCCKHGGRNVFVQVRREGDALLLRIGDDGPGIAPEAAANLLERGTRLDRRTPGQGIGLAIAADIARSYGGGLEIAASESGGTLFRVRLAG